MHFIFAWCNTILHACILSLHACNTILHVCILSLHASDACNTILKWFAIIIIEYIIEYSVDYSIEYSVEYIIEYSENILRIFSGQGIAGFGNEIELMVEILWWDRVGG